MRKEKGYGLANALLGWAEAEVRGVMPEAFLNECARRGVTLLRSERRDELTLFVAFPLWQRTLLEQSAAAGGCETALLCRGGLGVWWRRRRERWALFAGALGVAVALFVSSLFIWEIEVTENFTEVSDQLILSALEDAGVGIGSFWPGLSIDMVRSRALRELPELSYLTVNVHGSRAEVLVRGAEERPEIYDGGEKMDVVARKSGVITSVRVLEGERLCREGDTVAAGEVLVSARRGCALGGERLVHARAEITARTWYEKTAAVPLSCRVREEGEAGRRIWGVRAGKCGVFFARSSRISQLGCDTIYSAHVLSKKSTFALPLALLSRRTPTGEYRASEWDGEAARETAEDTLRNWLLEEIGGEGSVTRLHFTSERQGDILYVTLRAECLERIDGEQPHG